MKVGVLSRHSVANYGTLFQAYALQTTIEKMGYEDVNINYTPAGEVGGQTCKDYNWRVLLIFSEC